MPPFRVALTGGIGSGKSVIASQFAELGVPIIDSDIISRELVKSGSSILQEIITKTGPEILDIHGELDRDSLRQIIFNDEKIKSQLENILHPAIYKKIDEQTGKIDYPYCLIVIPLLIETNAMSHFDRILVIDAPENIQFERTIKRDGSSAELVRNIIKSQVTRENRLKYADDIIDNTVEIDELKHIVEDLHLCYLNYSNADSDITH